MGRDVGGHRSSGALAALLAIVVAALAGCGGGSTRGHAQPTSVPLVFPTHTPTMGPADPASLGWTRVTAGHLGTVQFAASDPQRGYYCATDDASGGAGRVFGVTTDGGQTWQVKPSPATYPTCRIEVSPTDPLKLTINSVNLPGDGQAAFVDAHYSSNSGQTWQAAPIPPNTLSFGQALWAGASLYMFVGGNKGQSSLLEVSTSGGPFTAINLGTVAPGVTSPNIAAATTAGDTFYLTVSGNCPQQCMTISVTADGGKSWRQVRTLPNLLVTDAEGSTLYAVLFSNNGTSNQLQTSADGGATWAAVTMPALPDGTVAGEFVAARDGTIFTATPHAVYALHGQTWNAIIFATGGTWAVSVIGIATDAVGHPTRVYIAYEGPQPGIFAHTL
jgi:hypothetical protein